MVTHPLAPPYPKDSGFVASYSLAGERSVFGLYAYSKCAAAAWVHIFDLAALPVDGTAPTLPPIAIPGHGGVSIEWNQGRTFFNGCTIALSTTEDTLTISVPTDLSLTVEDGKP